MLITEKIKKKNVIGIENIPIYQSLPDIILREYYLKQENPLEKTRYYYVLLNQKSALPQYIVVANEEAAVKYMRESAKKDLIEKITKNGYKKIGYEKLNLSLLKIFRDERDYFMSGLIQAPLSISLYNKSM